MLNQFKISIRIYILGGVLISLLIFTSAISLVQMSKIGKELVGIAEEDIPLTQQIVLLTEHQLTQALLAERFVVQLLINYQDNNSKSVNELSMEIKNSQERSVELFSKTLSFLTMLVEKKQGSSLGKQFFEFRQSLQINQQEYENISLLLTRLLSFTVSTDKQDMISIVKQLEENNEKLDKSLIKLAKSIEELTAEAALTAEHDEQSAIKYIFVSLTFSLLIGAIFPYFINKSITKPIVLLTSRLEEAGQGNGDLTVKLDESSKDETGDLARAFNIFTEKLRNVIVKTNNYVEKLELSANSARDIVENTLEDVERQRAETEMVATAVTQMSAATQEVATSTSFSANVTESVKEKVLSGQSGAQTTQDIINQLAGEVQQAARVIAELGEETQNIGVVLETIKAIADQTNLLALNAAIEAARAGESGRGFAVVADEVRSLAQRTQHSTVDIQRLVERLQDEAKRAVQSMEKGDASARLCLSQSAETSSIFVEAADAVNEIFDLNNQVVSATEQQSLVAEEINQNLVNIKDIAEKTSDGARQSANANKQISDHLTSLRENMSAFQV